jgi:hypothetical protein
MPDATGTAFATGSGVDRAPDGRRVRDPFREPLTMKHTLRTTLGGALLAALAAGCSASPPGAGFTSGDKPTLTSDEKAGVRDDLRDAPPSPANASPEAPAPPK